MSGRLPPLEGAFFRRFCGGTKAAYNEYGNTGNPLRVNARGKHPSLSHG